jgi:hypothetical protein
MSSGVISATSRLGRLVVVPVAAPPGRTERTTLAPTPPTRSERVAVAQQRRAAARARDLTTLLRERPDLAGVHAPADLAVEAVRWCA